MKKNQKVKVLSILVILFLSIHGNVQAQRGTQVKSPEINSNNSVTFRFGGRCKYGYAFRKLDDRK
jgi:hypothetical protein